MNSLLKRLLALPEPTSGNTRDAAYGELSLSESEIQHLKSLLANETNAKESLSEDEQERADIHAWRALGATGSMRFFDLFLTMLQVAVRESDDIYLGDYDKLMASIGDISVPPLLKVLFDHEEHEEVRTSVLMALDLLAKEGTLQNQILSDYHRYLSEKYHTRDLNAYIVSFLIDHGQKDQISLIKEAFFENRINVSITGDLESVEIDLGLRKSRDAKGPNVFELEQQLCHQARRDALGPPPAPDEYTDILNYFLQLHGTERSMKSVSEFDGFLIATLSGPELIIPSRYISFFWDATHGDPDVQPIWDSQEDLQTFMEAVMTHHNTVMESLGSEYYSTLGQGYQLKNGFKMEIYSHWATGAATGIDQWNTTDETFETIREDLLRELHEIVLLESNAVEKLETQPERCVSKAPLERALTLFDEAHYLNQIQPAGGPTSKTASLFDPTPGLPVHREAPKISRNSPCPCGSGRKFKKCCMN